MSHTCPHCSKPIHSWKLRQMGIRRLYLCPDCGGPSQLSWPRFLLADALPSGVGMVIVILLNKRWDLAQAGLPFLLQLGIFVLEIGTALFLLPWIGLRLFGRVEALPKDTPIKEWR